jgi:hypothetical protein
MPKHSAEFKESQLYDWEVEPSEERPSAFFHSTGFDPVGVAYVRGRKSRGPNVVLLVGALLVGLGIVALLAMRKWLPALI